MAKTCVCLAVAVAVAAASCTIAAAQVVSEWRTARNLPVAVVEVAGGDVEHFAALIPADAAPPAAVAGFPTKVKPGRLSQLWSATVPSLAAQPALAEFVAALSASGSAALVVMGPVPAREVQSNSAAIEAIPAREPGRLPCVLAEGGVAVRRGVPDSVELAIALPPADDARGDIAPALISLVRGRLASGVPDARVGAELEDDCARMVVRVAAHDEHPRAVLRRLRQVLAQLPATPVSEEELSRALAACQALSGQAAVGGDPVAEELAKRLARGGSAVRAFATPSIDSGTMAEFARQVLSGHPGFATLVEQERRPQAEPPQTLDNGVVLTTNWIPGETGVVALALGGIAPRSGRDILEAAATAAAREGWPAVLGEIAGVPTLAIAAPGPSVTDVIERLSESVSAARPVARNDVEAEAARTIGLADSLTAETVSVALALPPEVEVGTEAAGKFFGSLASGRLSAGIAPAGPGLKWTVGEGTPQVLGIANLPPSAAGMVGWQVLHDRLIRETGIRATSFAPAGRLLLAVASEGGPSVPVLDGRLAALWKGALRPATGAEVAAAALQTLATLYGDTAQATARAAAAAFLPAVPTQAELLGIDVKQVNAVIAALPAWDTLTRFARGAPPPAPDPSGRKGSVRKSRSPQGEER